MSDKGPIPPHSEESERALVSSILQRPLETLDLCREHGLGEEQFYNPTFRTIYAATLEMQENNRAIDLVTVTTWLREKNNLESVGGPAELTAILNFVPSAANAEYYIDAIHRKFLRRQMIHHGTEMIRRAHDENRDELEILDQAQAEITALSEETFTETPTRPIAADVDETVEYLEKIYKKRGRDAIHGVATGFHDLDRMTGGFVGGQLIVIAGRPAMGKTIFGLNIAIYLATKKRVLAPSGRELDGPASVLIFSLEMTRQQVMRRFFVAQADQGDKFIEKVMRTGLFSQEEINVVIPKVAGQLRGAPIFLDATAGLRIPDFKARARRMKAQHHIALIIIDYVQLMKSPTKRAQDNRQLEMSEITGSLKEMAKELNVPIIALAQLNRDTEKRSMGEPRLMDLRESGSLENDADFVGLLYRRHYYSHEDEDLGKAELIVAKHRDGPPGRLEFHFAEKQMRFKNLHRQFSNDPEERQQLGDVDDDL